MSVTVGNRRIGHSLVLEAGSRQLQCAECQHGLGPANENFRLQCRLVERPVTSMDGAYRMQSSQIADRMVFREFLCPSCGLRLDTEIARKGDAILADLRIQS
jgi:acetone carboxylase gamma subunit